MKTKLTLSIDSAKVKRVKAFGRKRKKSVDPMGRMRSQMGVRLGLCPTGARA